jgi:hypothetical protein
MLLLMQKSFPILLAKQPDWMTAIDCKITADNQLYVGIATLSRFLLSPVTLLDPDSNVTITIELPAPLVRPPCVASAVEVLFDIQQISNEKSIET